MPRWIQIQVVSDDEEKRTSRPADAPARRSRRPVWLTLGIVVLLVVAAGSIWWLRRQPSTPVVRRANPSQAAGIASTKAQAPGAASQSSAATTDDAQAEVPALTEDIQRRLESERPVAIVNGEVITEGELEREVAIGRVLFPLLQGIPVDNKPETLQRMRSDLLSSLVDELLLVQAAREAGLEVTDAEVDDRLNEILSQTGLSKEELTERLVSVGVTLDDLRASLRSTLLAQRFVRENPPPEGISAKSPSNAWVLKLQQEADIQIMLEEGKTRTVKIGQPPPTFVLRNPDGEAVRLNDFIGQPLLINFWATWCPPCRLEMPILEKAYQDHKDEGFVVLAVDLQEEPEKVKAYLQEMGLTFPVALDRSGAVAAAYRVQGIPNSVFVDRNGVVTDIHRGALTEGTLQGYLEKVLKR